MQNRRKRQEQEAGYLVPKVANADEFAARHPFVAGFLAKLAQDNRTEAEITLLVKCAAATSPEARIAFEAAFVKFAVELEVPKPVTPPMMSGPAPSGIGKPTKMPFVPPAAAAPKPTLTAPPAAKPPTNIFGEPIEHFDSRRGDIGQAVTHTRNELPVTAPAAPAPTYNHGESRDPVSAIGAWSKGLGLNLAGTAGEFGTAALRPFAWAGERAGLISPETTATLRHLQDRMHNLGGAGFDQTISPRVSTAANDAFQNEFDVAKPLMNPTVHAVSQGIGQGSYDMMGAAPAVATGMRALGPTGVAALPTAAAGKVLKNAPAAAGNLYKNLELYGAADNVMNEQNPVTNSMTVRLADRAVNGSPYDRTVQDLVSTYKPETAANTFEDISNFLRDQPPPLGRMHTDASIQEQAFSLLPPGARAAVVAQNNAAGKPPPAAAPPAAAVPPAATTAAPPQVAATPAGERVEVLSHPNSKPGDPHFGEMVGATMYNGGPNSPGGGSVTTDTAKTWPGIGTPTPSTSSPTADLITGAAGDLVPKFVRDRFNPAGALQAAGATPPATAPVAPPGAKPTAAPGTPQAAVAGKPMSFEEAGKVKDLAPTPDIDESRQAYESAVGEFAKKNNIEPTKAQEFVDKMRNEGLTNGLTDEQVNTAWTNVQAEALKNNPALGNDPNAQKGLWDTFMGLDKGSQMLLAVGLGVGAIGLINAMTDPEAGAGSALMAAVGIGVGGLTAAHNGMMGDAAQKFVQPVTGGALGIWDMIQGKQQGGAGGADLAKYTQMPPAARAAALGIPTKPLADDDYIGKLQARNALTDLSNKYDPAQLSQLLDGVPPEQKALLLESIKANRGGMGFSPAVADELEGVLRPPVMMQPPPGPTPEQVIRFPGGNPNVPKTAMYR